MSDAWLDARGRPAVVFYRDRRRRWRFRVIGANGEKMAASEAYSTHAAARRGVLDLFARLVEGSGANP